VCRFLFGSGELLYGYFNCFCAVSVKERGGYAGELECGTPL
jgi:hypothetical protein